MKTKFTARTKTGKIIPSKFQIMSGDVCAHVEKNGSVTLCIHDDENRSVIMEMSQAEISNLVMIYMDTTLDRLNNKTKKKGSRK